MAVDIVPELIDSIRREFERHLMADPKVRNITRKIETGTATLVDIHEYSIALGEWLSYSMRQYMTPDTMPDGKIYWNIANRIIKPFLRTNYDAINATAEKIQEIVNAAEDISIAAVKADFPDGRVEGLINQIVNDAENPFRWLAEPIVNVTESFSDDYMKANADFRYKAGLDEKIIRSVESSAVRTSKGRKYDIPCDWCKSLAGVYSYPNTPDEIFRRHEFCRCSVTYKSERKRETQNVWSKEIWQDSADTLTERRNAGNADQLTPAQRIANAVAMSAERR